MTIIECTGSPFTYTWPGGTVRLIPGRPVELPDDRAARLLAKAPGRVRVVALTENDLTGQIVNWNSPLFGSLRATALETLPRGVRVRHPLTEVDCVIPLAWLRHGLDG